MRKVLTFVSSFFLAACTPIIVSAHEVYVLSPAEIRAAVAIPSPNPFSIVSANEKLFLVCGVVGLLLVFTILFLSISPLFERVFDPLLRRLKVAAPLIGRLTIGVSFLASGYFKDFFGPELPIASLFSPAPAVVVSWILMIVGALFILGLFTRPSAFVGLCLFVVTVWNYHWYMFTYVNYLGEIILFLILGGGTVSLDRLFFKQQFGSLAKALEKYSFFILRLCFGFSLFFASFYAKFIHSNLALDTVKDYNLTIYFFHFSPLCIVLGAFLIETAIGLCFFLGFEIRFATMVFIFFLTLSLLFFGEVVWPHLILFGAGLALFCHGYDTYTASSWLQRKRCGKSNVGEPVF